MKDTTLNKHMTESLKLKEQIEALQAEKDKHDEAIKAELTERGEETYAHGDHKVSYKKIISMRFDSKRFSAENPETYEEYKTESVSMRYKIA